MELLVVISIVAILAVSAYSAFGTLIPRFKAGAAADQARKIQVQLVAYAVDTSGDFPVSTNASNEAYRELFKARLMDSEKPFCIQSDPYITKPNKVPDGDLGSAPEYSQALEVGECSFGYVSGLSQSSRSDLPLIFNGFAEGSIGKWTTFQDKKGGVFQGRYGVVVNVGGAGEAMKLSSPDFQAKVKRGSRDVDMFGSEYFGESASTDGIMNPQ